MPSTPPLVAQSSDNLRYAAIVVDAESGEVLFARHADSRRYPASITKVMTLYMTFEALAEGRVKPDDVITVSPHAASQPPSKLGLAAGQTITLDNAMKATAVRSANDMAVAIAEHVGGSEARFTAQMTLKARELGMTQTRYVNANGLPDARQLTSARDLAILARAVMRDFPQYYRYFGLHDWVYEGREYRNTNGLLRTGLGYDGMKTGYTNASGYNLAASAVRDGKRLITIVLGGRTTASRNAHVAELMNTGFEVERARANGQLIRVAQTWFEERGFGIGSDNAGPVQYASLEREEEAGETAVTYASLPSPPAPAPASTEARTVAALLRADASASDVTAALNGAASTTGRAARPAPQRSDDGWMVQVGAFREESVAREWLTEVNRRFRSQFANAERTVQNASGWYRSRFTGMTEAAAQAACATLAERRVTCMVVRPE
ncbi:SPOR domain-containing protein [Brevundimonas sp.]|uniref:D-alanyl-D-alanine carboxypeptidase family protein n=1 Tax=Brevundimonas sp. TaxID=1871086 RepID=UPI0035ADE85B